MKIVEYNKDELIKAFQFKYKLSWRAFVRQKEGKWLYRNNIELYKKLKHNYNKDKADYRENKFQKRFVNKLSKFFDKNKIKYKLEEEVKIGYFRKINNRIDILLDLPEYDLTLAIELKHDLSHWTRKEINEQVYRYNYCLKSRNIKTYVVSPYGKYGFSEKQFMYIIKNLIKNEEIYLPNSLRFLKKNK